MASLRTPASEEYANAPRGFPGLPRFVHTAVLSAVVPPMVWSHVGAAAPVVPACVTACTFPFVSIISLLSATGVAAGHGVVVNWTFFHPPTGIIMPSCQ